jgi:hypothetical protein
MDLGPPTVIRLERALAHLSSRYGSETSTDRGRSCRISRGHTRMDPPASSRRSRDMAQPVNGKGDRCAGQTEPDYRVIHRGNTPGQAALRPARSAGRSSRPGRGTPRFPQRTRPWGLRLWINQCPQAGPRAQLASRNGETAVQRVHSLWTALWTTSCDQPSRLGQDTRGAHS